MKAPARLSPSFWWPLAVSLVFTTAVIWAGYGFFERLKQEQRATAAGTLTSIGKLKAEQIRYYFDRNQKFALSVARLLGRGEMAGWLRGGAPVMPEAMRESLLSVLRNRGENALLILDPDTRVRFSAGQFTQLTEEGRRLALSAATEPPPVTSDIYRGDPSAPHQALLDTFVPIRGTEDGHALGVLVLRSDLVHLYELIQTWPVASPTAESALVRLEGDHALFLNELRFKKQTALRMQVPLSASQNSPGWPSTAAARGQVGIWEARDYLDHAVLAHTLPVAGPVPGWGMVVKMDIVEVFAPVERLMNVARGVTAAFILFALLALGSWLWLLAGKAERETAERQRIVALNEKLELAIEQQKQAQDQLDRFFTLSLDMLCIASADGYFKRISPAFTTTLGWSVEEILARPFLDFVHPDDHPATLLEVEKQVTAGEKVLDFENRYRHKDGSWRVLSWNSMPQPGGGLMYASARDITERKQLEDQMAGNLKALAEFKAALDEHAIVAITGAHGRITYVNDKFCAISKYSREELMGRDHRIINSGHHPKAFIRELWQTIRGGKVWHGEIKNRAKDGAFYWVDTTIVPFLDEDGEPSQHIAIRTDITERKQAEETIVHLNAQLQGRATQLEATNKELESFAYSVSHDLRAPLRGMDGFSQALLEDYADHLDGTGQDYLRRIRAGAQRMGHLIDDLLTLSQVTRSEMVVDAVDLAALAHKVIAELQPQQAGRAVEWEVSDPLTARGDPRLLQLVLHNLLANALKFTGKCEHARIELGQAAQGAEQVFFVRDNGAGFDMAYANRLFGAFQRLHSFLEFPGTGIGLATVQRIIHRHGGRVWAEAQPGKGATFSFTLETAN